MTGGLNLWHAGRVIDRTHGAKRGREEREPRFALGRVVMAPQARLLLTDADVDRVLQRYVRGDWGDVPPAVRAGNERALKDSTLLVGHYQTTRGVCVLVTTDPARTVTIVMLPEEFCALLDR